MSALRSANGELQRVNRLMAGELSKVVGLGKPLAAEEAAVQAEQAEQEEVAEAEEVEEAEEAEEAECTCSKVFSCSARARRISLTQAVP